MASGATLGGCSSVASSSAPSSPSIGGSFSMGPSDGAAARVGSGTPAKIGVSSSSVVGGPGLYEFLIEAELQQYYAGIRNDLKVQNVSQLKYVTEEDLQNIGMSKPEMRRLKKFFQKHFPQNYLSKFKKMILPKKEEQWRILLPPPEEAAGRAGGRPPVRVPNKHIIPSEAIMVNKELGTGEFGVVQQGVWTNEGERIQVAIKCLSRERMQSNPIEFLKEAAIMHAIDHEHIVRLYGVVLDTNALMLVTELAPLRSLLECLKEPSLRPSFPVLSLCDFAIQICDGMQYLELKRLIHRDLAARNILVFSKNKVKISDFGLSRALGVGKDYYQTNFNVNLKLPIAWCAPECITFLRFTSASDVWAFGVTLWEMFSYGFQPWAALTGHQILEAIDEPNCQRLEQPECCPKDYFTIMLRCWAHDPSKRPKFSELMTLLPECKPEQVQAVQEFHEDPVKVKREQLQYKVQDVITVLDKGPMPGVNSCWKGVLNSGKAGLFNPAHTVAYLGSNLPTSVKSSEFSRGDGKNTYSSRRRLRPDMISSPQGDLKHTGHVGLDGAYFGDISFLGGKVTPYPHLPHQVVTPYKPQDDGRVIGPDEHVPLMRTSSLEVSSSDKAPLLLKTGGGSTGGARKPCLAQDNNWSDASSEKGTVGVNSSSGSSSLSRGTGSSNSKGILLLADHEYHEISDEEDGGGANHSSCKDYSLDGYDDDEAGVESPRFEKSFDFGPSLMDEMDAMLRSWHVGGTLSGGMESSAAGGSTPAPPPPRPGSRTPPPVSGHHQSSEDERHGDGGDKDSHSQRHRDDSTHNMRNELREMAAKMGGKKKQATVKPISAADQKTLESAIAMATEMASRSMLEADGGGMLDSSRGDALDSPPNTPRTPASPSRRKFSFKFSSGVKGGVSGGNGSPKAERRNFAEEAASIQDIQSTLTEEAKAVYNSLVEQPALPAITPSIPHHHHHSHQHHHHQHTNPPRPATTEPVDPDETNPLRMLRSGFGVRPRVRGNKHQSLHITSSSGTQNHFQRQHRLGSLGERGSSGRSSLPRPPLDVSGVTSRISPPIPITSSPPADDSPDDEEDEDGEEDEGNPIPLPPRDRTRKSSSDQPRHQRRHPLVFPGSGITHAVAKISSGGDVENSLDGIPSLPAHSAMQSVDGSGINEEQQSSISKSDPSRLDSPEKPPRILCNMDDSFENQIASELEALDNIQEEEGSTLSSSPMTTHMFPRNSVHHQSSSLPHPSQPPPPPPSSSLPPSTPSPPLAPSPTLGCQPAPSANENGKDGDVDEVDGGAGDSQMLRNGDHVSCEDLLEFACDGPNVRRTRGRARGVDSDEVRIMGKVLGKEISVESCLSALNATDWDVHRAIKVVHLQSLLLGSPTSSPLHSSMSSANCRLSSTSFSNALDPMSAFEALSVCGWDVARAAGWYLAAREEGDTTEV
ncbi:activated Cdc42 kinase-like [Hetaerina americana]|uniref:activated Cdc42 kinase-like n=1 Tax=Hetaerina americana TaxID=62018 RepID=UPI003A7F2C0F